MKKQKHIRGTKYKEATKKLDKSKVLPISDAVATAKKSAYANFKESVELHINLGTDPKNNDHRIRFTTSLPHGIGKTIKILVVSEDNSGAKGDIIYRDESVVADILAGKLQVDKDFNIVISTAAQMKELAKVARILGPKGIMPSPKFGTVTDDLEKAISNLSKGQIEVRSQPSHAVIHQVVGKLDFETSKLEENVSHILKELEKHTPTKLKKKFIQSVYLTSSMGPGIKIEA